MGDDGAFNVQGALQLQGVTQWFRARRGPILDFFKIKILVTVDFL